MNDALFLIWAVLELVALAALLSLGVDFVVKSAAAKMRPPVAGKD